MASLSDRIKQRGQELGIDKIGIVSATALESEKTQFEEWLKRGFHGEMLWLERDTAKRTDPRLIFPAAESVIVVAQNYFTGHKHSDDPKTGKLSRYAWGDDYHDVLREKLNALLEYIKSEVPGTEGKICVDTAPMMDKVWAVRAGLGWIGKHTNVITTDLGSWIFIGEIILNINLDHDTNRVEDHCGTCTACLDACPTHAIAAPYVVDSRRCISYATIELRDETLPADVAANLNGWLYGCDICQDVCPWNRFETPTAESRFEPRFGATSLNLEDVAAMDHDEYVVRFRRSAIKRTKLSGLKRNASHINNKNPQET